jgi:hypothetical protein
MKDIIEKLEQFNIDLDEAISYEDWNAVEEVRKEITFLIGDLDDNLPMSQFDDEY